MAVAKNEVCAASMMVGYSANGRNDNARPSGNITENEHVAGNANLGLGYIMDSPANFPEHILTSLDAVSQPDILGAIRFQMPGPVLVVTISVVVKPCGWTVGEEPGHN